MSEELMDELSGRRAFQCRECGSLILFDRATNDALASLNREAAYWRGLAEQRRKRVNRLALLLAALGLWMTTDGTIRLLSALGVLQ